MIRQALRWLAWATLAFIAVVTLSPIEMRPVVDANHSGHVEHFCAFALVGFLFVLAYPKRLVSIALSVILVAVALEVLQLIVPGRHGRLVDATVKCCGALTGIALAIALRHGYRITWLGNMVASAKRITKCVSR